MKKNKKKTEENDCLIYRKLLSYAAAVAAAAHLYNVNRRANKNSFFAPRHLPVKAVTPSTHFGKIALEKSHYRR